MLSRVSENPLKNPSRNVLHGGGGGGAGLTIPLEGPWLLSFLLTFCTSSITFTDKTLEFITMADLKTKGGRLDFP